jgi:uncharacterized membrane protein HdeD (DUF308 family)
VESSSDRISELWRTEVTKVRWAVGVRGVLSIALGVLILVWPGISLVALTIVVGVYALANGMIELGYAFTAEAKGRRGWFVFSGLLGIAFGVMVLAWPSISSLALLYVIGAYAIGIGILAIGASFQLPLDGRDTALMILGGLVAILFGIVMFARPGAGALVTLTLIAAFALVTGISQLVLAIGGERLVEHEAKRLFSPKQTPKHQAQPSH